MAYHCVGMYWTSGPALLELLTKFDSCKNPSPASSYMDRATHSSHHGGTTACPLPSRPNVVINTVIEGLVLTTGSIVKLRAIVFTCPHVFETNIFNDSKKKHVMLCGMAASKSSYKSNTPPIGTLVTMPRRTSHKPSQQHQCTEKRQLHEPGE